MAWPCALGLLLTHLLLTESARGVKSSQILPCLLRERGARPPAMVASAFSKQLHTNENVYVVLPRSKIREESQTNLRNDLLRVNSVTLCVSVVKLLEKTFTTEARRSHREPQRVTLRPDLKEVWARK